MSEPRVARPNRSHNHFLFPTNGLVALVSGANKGLGKEVAGQMARKGMRVYLDSRDRERGLEAAAELMEQNLAVSVLELDVTSPKSVAAAAAQTMLTVQYANAFRRRPEYAHIKVNSATPGYIATDLNNHQGNRTVKQGALVVIELATIDSDGPSGGFFNDEGAVAW